MDRLLLAGVVEARGNERFQRIADALEEGPMKIFYEDIARSEARHAEMFVELAIELFPEADVSERLEFWLDREVEAILRRSTPRSLALGYRMVGSPTLHRYLARYAEPDCDAVKDLDGHWKSAVAIPRVPNRRHLRPFWIPWRRRRGASESLALVVVNGSDSSPEHHHTRNRDFLAWIRKRIGVPEAPQALGRFREDGCSARGPGDRGRRFPARRGRSRAENFPGYPVGLVCQWPIGVAVGSLDGRGCLGAAGLLDSNASSGDGSALWMAYEHVGEGGESQESAMMEYEIYLHYHSLGLQSAGSPYPFPCIGSTLWIHVEKYAAVRGFPKKEAGEDFYLLNKLAKVAPVRPLPGERLKVRGRLSDRVPFGTGAALNKMASQGEGGVGYPLYDPRVYSILAAFLRAWRRVGETGDVDVLTTWLREFGETHPGGLEALEETGVEEAARAAVKHAKPGFGLTRRLDEWMDGFRTMRLMHRLRDAGVPNVPWRNAVADAEFCPVTGNEPPEEVCARLREEVEARCGFFVGGDCPQERLNRWRRKRAPVKNG